MSYSFVVRANCAAALAVAATKELDKVSEQQPIHAKDREAAEAALRNLLDLVETPAENEELSASVTGSSYGDEGKAFRGVTLSIIISVLAKTSG